jgi:hypothetical protein
VEILKGRKFEVILCGHFPGLMWTDRFLLGWLIQGSIFVPIALCLFLAGEKLKF